MRVPLTREHLHLADGVLLAHGADEGSKLILEVGHERGVVGEHEIDGGAEMPALSLGQRQEPAPAWVGF
ncbi:hypothetical protein [Pseudorhodoferax soli]|uniref:hypothetical protein n=1 Tax=Pseudorhodoferax soli TaxID=545864 RepID=UPI001B873F74